MNGSNTHRKSPTRTATHAGTVEASGTWQQPGPQVPRSFHTTARIQTPFPSPPGLSSSAMSTNSNVIGGGPSSSFPERPSSGLADGAGSFDDDRVPEQLEHQQSAAGYSFSRRCFTESDLSLQHGQQQGFYCLSNSRLQEMSMAEPTGEETAEDTQASEPQGQAQRRNLPLWQWNELSRAFAAKARLLRFDWRLPKADRAIWATALDQMEGYHAQVVKYCLMHVDDFLEYGFDCCLTGEQREEKDANSMDKAKDFDRHSTCSPEFENSQMQGLGVRSCRHRSVTDLSEAGHEADNESDSKGQEVSEGTSDGARNERQEEPSTTASRNRTRTDAPKSEPLPTKDTETAPMIPDAQNSGASQDGFQTSRKPSMISDSLPAEEEAGPSQQSSDKGKSICTAQDQVSAYQAAYRIYSSAMENYVCTTTIMRTERLEAVILSLERACVEISCISDEMEEIARRLRVNYHIYPETMRLQHIQQLAFKSGTLRERSCRFCHRMACETKRLELVLDSAAIPPEDGEDKRLETDRNLDDSRRGSRLRPSKPTMHGALMPDPAAKFKQRGRSLGQIVRGWPALGAVLTRTG